jgi:hypothetical protein
MEIDPELLDIPIARKKMTLVMCIIISMFKH